VPRAAIEGTQLSMDLVTKYAQRHPPELMLDAERKHAPVVLRRRVTYHGFELSHEREPLPIFPAELAVAARHLLAESAARGELRHPAVRRNQPNVDEIRTVWRKLGGRTTRLGQAELTAWYEAQLADVWSYDDMRALPLALDRRQFLREDDLAAARALPDRVELREKVVELDYDIEERDGATTPVVRLRLPEKLARTLIDEELPALDRPLRFIVQRGQRGAVRADTLTALQDRLDDPYTDEERDRLTAQRAESRSAREDRGRSSQGRHGGGRQNGGRHGGGHQGGGGKFGGRSGGGRGGGRKRR
jgi:ATP-dependent helicase HrpA